MALIDPSCAVLNRRRLVAMAATLPAFALIGGGSAAAQGRKLFGIKLPKELDAILPLGAIDIAETVDAILTLERDANLKNLPASILSGNAGAPIAATDGSVYEMALPRLVALIDRSEFRDSIIAEKAGGLLARLHASQRVVPDGLRGFSGVQPLTGLQDGRLYIDAQSAEAAAPILALPDIAVPAQGAAEAPMPPIETDPALPEIGTADIAVPPVEGAPGVTISDTPVTPAEAPAAEIPPSEIPPSEIPPEPKPQAPTQPDRPLSRRRDFASLADEYIRLFASATLRPEHNTTTDWHLKMLLNSRARYEQVASITGVPWYFIGVTHGLEASFNFRAHLHNGDFPLSRRTRQIPSGRPRVWLPPDDWASSARDALALLGFTGQKDWSLARTLYRLEAYNGLGYRSFGVPTPYLWSFSNHYSRGKFVADGKWNANARSQQCGAAVMLKMLNSAGEINLA